MIGQQVGSYRIVRKLGEGGMGAVYEGVQEQIARRVAIKVLLAGAAGDAQIAQRFFNEARAVNLIDHPSLVEIFDMGHLPDGTAYIVMELLKGESLTDRIGGAPHGLGTPALRITRQIASALAAAHEKQIVHRDLKPDNVMLVPDPEAPGGERAKVLDFGIAKMAAELQTTPLKTSTHMLMGTPAYMAPEQCRSSTNVDDKADVYALGIMLFQMLSGRLPFDARDTMQLLYAHVHEPPPSLAAVVDDAPAQLVAAVDAMLAKEPTRRPTMAEVAATMAQLGGGVSTGGRPAPMPSRPPATVMPSAVPVEAMPSPLPAEPTPTLEPAAPSPSPLPTRFRLLGTTLIPPLVVMGFIAYQLHRSGMLNLSKGFSSGFAAAVGESSQWDSEPVIADVDGDGFEDILGRYRTLQPTQSWVGAFAGANFQRLWRVGPFSDSDAQQAIHVAVSAKRVLVTDDRQTARVLDLATGKELGSVPMSDRAGDICGAPDGPPQFFVETTDKERMLIETDPVRSHPASRPSWCGVRASYSLTGGSDCFGAAMHAHFKARCVPARQAPSARGFRAEWVLRDEHIGVAVGAKDPGTRVPMLLGFDPAQRIVSWTRVLPTVDPKEVEEGAAALTDIAHGTVYSYYRLKGSSRGGRLIAIDANSGSTRWDVIVPNSGTGSHPDTTIITERRIYVPHWTWLDVFDAKSGAHLGTIGKF